MSVRFIMTRALGFMVLVLASPIILCVAIMAAVWLVHFLCTAYIPTAHFMQQKLYWYTWHDIKRAGQRPTKAVLRALFCLSEHDVIECRLRDAVAVKRLRKHYMFALLGKNELLDSKPSKVELVPFYEFRFRRQIVRPRRTRFARMQAPVAAAL